MAQIKSKTMKPGQLEGIAKEREREREKKDRVCKAYRARKEQKPAIGAKRDVPAIAKRLSFTMCPKRESRWTVVSFLPILEKRRSV